MSNLRMTSDLRRQLILGAAKRCFARNGFAGTTTKSVAAAAAISEGLLFKHFPSKAALYAEILAEECEADPELAHLAIAVPADAVTASGSGLDPHISPAYAALQAPRIAREHGLSLDRVHELIKEHTDDRALGFLGEPGVDVLELNLALAGR